MLQRHGFKAEKLTFVDFLAFLSGYTMKLEESKETHCIPTSKNSFETTSTLIVNPSMKKNVNISAKKYR